MNKTERINSVQILRGDTFVQVRLEPLSVKTRVKVDLTKRETGVDGNIEEFINRIRDQRDRIFDKRNVERKNSLQSTFTLEHIFWRIGNDPYVKNS